MNAERRGAGTGDCRIPAPLYLRQRQSCECFFFFTNTQRLPIFSFIGREKNNKDWLRYDLKTWSKGISRLTVLTQHCNWAVAELDGLEDQRPLTIPKANFCRIVKAHLLKLLSYQKQHRRKRCTGAHDHIAPRKRSEDIWARSSLCSVLY